MFNYVRGKTWLSPPFSVAKMAELIQRDPTGDNCALVHITPAYLIFINDCIFWFSDAFTDQDKERFKDPEYYKEFRHEIDNDLNVRFSLPLLFASVFMYHPIIVDSPRHAQGHADAKRGTNSI